MATGNSQINKNHHIKFILYIDNFSLTCSTFNLSKKCFESIERHSLKNDSQKLISLIDQLLPANTISHQYSNTLVAINQTQSIFIPEQLYDEKNINNYINLNKSSENYLITKQKFTNCYSISSIDQKIEKFLKKKFIKINIKSFPSVLVDYSIYRSKKNKNEVFIYLEKDRFNIVYLQDKQFIFHNQFSFECQNDFLYFFTNCLHVLNIDQQKTSVNIISNLVKKHSCFDLMNDYIQNIIFLNKPDNFLYSQQLLDFHDYQNHHIFSQIICE